MRGCVRSVGFYRGFKAKKVSIGFIGFVCVFPLSLTLCACALTPRRSKLFLLCFNEPFAVSLCKSFNEACDALLWKSMCHMFRICTANFFFRESDESASAAPGCPSKCERPPPVPELGVTPRKRDRGLL